MNENFEPDTINGNFEPEKNASTSTPDFKQEEFVFASEKYLSDDYVPPVQRFESPKSSSSKSAQFSEYLPEEVQHKINLKEKEIEKAVEVKE